ncbi:TPA: hypothetical protein N0F65_005661 [Lagenidium giganteum]|uniref:Leucine-rich repeat domain-containing protein n=1 Tax=Lagenidium giganteum TaxID=4803 RepID=A0AAV2ZBT4_9STRA|nr:TPA: hypothetical protein N0F65_005661 [Lagenidium giganteum]
MWLFVEHSDFTTVPDVLVGMDLTYLSLGFNQIQTVPTALFTNPSLTLVAMQGNPISMLPEVPAQNRTALDLLILDSTNLSVLPSWMDHSFLVTTKVYLGNTPYCDALGAANQTAETINHQLLCRKNDDCQRLHKIA